MKYPVTLLLILGSIIGFAIVKQAPFDVFGAFTFRQIIIENGSVVIDPLKDTQHWRYITPIFLHFTLLHLLSNGVMIFMIGRVIEQLIGSWCFSALVMALGAVSNSAQHYVSGDYLFGGLSGVIMGLIGFYIFYPAIKKPIYIPKLNYMVLLCCIAYSIMLYDENIAHICHAAGLITGLLIGFLTYWEDYI